MLDGLIIGGGIHGTTLAQRWLKSGPADIRILDPHPRLLARWTRLTRSTGMRFLRSPAWHHLHADPRHLEQFAPADAV
ncbi:MAG: NAD(P)-binding protein, partial [Chloroflexi bacterium]|nr:NAD(P)-binding protein [Chloroflexota bacterium]